MVQNLSNNLINMNPIENYNKIFEQNLNNIQDIQQQNPINDFEAVLSEKQQDLAQGNSPYLKSGISVNITSLDFPTLNADMSSFPDPVTQGKNVAPVEKLADSFSKAFSDGINDINTKQMEAEHATEVFAAGGDIDVHEVMMAAEKANLSMQMGLQIRNKLMNAYNELYNVKV